MRTANHRAIYIDAIAEGGDQNYVFIPHQADVPKLNPDKLKGILLLSFSVVMMVVIIYGAARAI